VPFSIWVWIVAGFALLLVALLAALWFVFRTREDDRRPVPRPQDPEPAWHVVEEYVPPSGDQPGRWVETRHTRDRGEAEQEWRRLRREDPANQDGVRIVTTTADPGARPRTSAPAGWGSGPSAPAPRQPSPAERLTFMSAPGTAPLYDRLVRFARTDGVFALVTERLYLRILGQRPDPSLGPEDRVEYAMRHGDPALVPVFTGMLRQEGGRDRLETHMTHFLMGALGGPKRYSGRGMAAAHGELGITDVQFDRVIGHVVAVLEELDVPGEWIGEVGGTVAPLREAIVVAPVGS
jgi:hemoglobin